MDKSYRKKIIMWILFLGWISFIFYMSNQPAVISDQQSGFVIDLIKAMGIDIGSKFGELTNFAVRKAAHVSEYCVLAFISYNLVRCYTDKKNHARIYCILIVFLYACTDEIHQLFVPGRSGMFRDVLIDTSGAVIAVVVLYIIDRVKSKNIMQYND